jgi:two-component system, NtrC family, sensor histidine kinase HydH
MPSPDPAPAGVALIPMRRADPLRIARGVRWMLLGAAVLTSTVLVATAWQSYGSVREATRLLAQGQGEAVLEAVRRDLLALGRPVEIGDLVRIRDAGVERGLRYLALVTETRTLETGERLGPPVVADEPAESWRTQSFGVTEIGSRLRLAAYSRTRRRRPEPVPIDAGAGDVPHDAGAAAPAALLPVAPRPPADLILEYEPVIANRLGRRAVTSFATSLAAALLLLAGALIAARWLAARDREAQARIRERQLASVGALSAVLAHEIRNPLASLKGNAQLLAENLTGGAHQSRADRVVHEAVRLEQLTSGLLDFVRTGEIHRRATGPAAVLTAAVAEVGAGHIDVDTAGAPASWSLDPDRMQQVLSNVLRNAVQASPADARVAVKLWSEGGRLHVRIRDRGPGIPAGQEDAIFEPFHTGKVRGTGLGLAVARWVVDLHGGVIRAATHPDGGAVIDLSIPE